MDFMMARLVEENRVHFGKRGEEHIIQLTRDGTVYEAVLRNTFNHDLPTTIVNRHQPWVRLSSDQIYVELRNNDTPWNICQKHWCIMSSTSRKGTYAMTSGRKTLVDSTGPFGVAVCKIFQSFEKAEYVEISYEQGIGVKVDLPRYHLTFSLQEETGRFRCLELDAEIDSDQSIGTFYGLQSRLVLTKVNASTYDKKRLVLIPFGPVTIAPGEIHVDVVIDIDEPPALKFFQYKIDNNLCQVDADGNFESHLFKAYLHAVTSSSLDDTLTSRTGTAEAIQALRDTITLTSVPVSETASDILMRICLLTPLREFYPNANFKTLQRSRWNPSLSSLSQYDGYCELATKISNHSIMANFLYEGEKQEVPEYSGNDDLRRRSLARAARYYSIEGEDTAKCSTLKDTVYTGRDRDHGESQLVAYQTAVSFFSWSAYGPILPDLYQLMQRFERVSGFAESFAPAGISGLLNLDMKICWPSLMSLCLSATRDDANTLAMELSLVAFGNPELASLVNTLTAFAIVDSIKALGPPADLSYDLTFGRNFCTAQISQMLKDCQIIQTGDIQQLADDNADDLDFEEEYIADMEYQRGLVMLAAKDAWLNGTIKLPDGLHLPDSVYDDLVEMLCQRFAIWRDNESLYQKCLLYGQELAALNKVRLQKSIPSLKSNCTTGTSDRKNQKPSKHVSAPSLLEAFGSLDLSRWDNQCPQLTDYDQSIRDLFTKGVTDGQTCDIVAHGLFRSLLVRLQQCNKASVKAVASTLQASLHAFEGDEGVRSVDLDLPSRRFLEVGYTDARNVVQGYLCALKWALRPRSEAEKGFEAAGLWPTTTVRSLLQLLKLPNREQLSKHGQEIVFNFAQAVAAMQRLARLLHFKFVGDEFALRKEVENEAHSAWSIQEHPDWLLLELQNDFLIRPVQVRVAQEMIKPRNGVVQLGMGEGKTSVILPMAIAALSNGSRLVRVVVLKSLANEMLQTLTKNLSGLVDRPVYHLPFSRSTPITQQNLSMLSVIRDDCKNHKGVLLTLPEHLNSFRLMGNDKIVANHHGIKERLLGTQKGFDNSAIDILDECDEILHPRNELVYTSGAPKPLSGAPDRWCVLLDLLVLVASNAGMVSETAPDSLEYIPTSVGTYPHIRVLKPEGYSLLQDLLLQDLKDGAMLQLPLKVHNNGIVDLAIRFIKGSNVSGEEIHILRQKFRRHREIDCLYLLHGMFAVGNLKAALESRWFVSYGLDRSRSYAAVPYRAKSTPSSAAEFAQPDMMILFTSLSYFYTGIKPEDLRHCLTLLLRSANSVEEYSKWIATSPVPPAYRNIKALVPESDMCIEQLYSSFRLSRDVISFFLRQVVFPREAKEFPQKLCSSAWDLCVDGPNRFVSGFSGTCDVLMPLNMVKQDIPELRHYDAAVIVDLLKERNRGYIFAGDTNKRPLDTGDLLRLISNDVNKPSVIIDVGAQVLDLNSDVAKLWLSLRRDKSACVFFDEQNEKTVVTRDGTMESWKSSPYKEQVANCLVFLDQYRCRGTDFVCPDTYSAAVLLGPRLGKDTLVQACMRMRKLSFSQSLVFVGTPEVDDSIRTSLKLGLTYQISTIDIVEWTIHQACTAKEQQRPLWVDRGLAFLQRHYAFKEMVRQSGSITNRAPYLRAILQDENQEVSTMYPGPNPTSSGTQRLPYKVDTNDPMARELLKHWESCQSSRVITCFNEQEQEREMLHEVEQEREVERPDSMNAQLPRINQELRRIINANVKVDRKPESLKSAFDILEHTSLRRLYQKQQWPPYLLATEDFLYPVKVADGSDLDDFLRPVNWLLVLRGLPHIILISCHEANTYMNDLKRSTVATMIMYHPLINKEAGSFDTLDVYQVSAMPNISGIDPKAQTALRLFAGQLYFNDFKEYTDFCMLLGLWDGKISLHGKEDLVDGTNYVPFKVRSTMSIWTGKWRINPVEMIRRFMGMRRQNEEWEHTHLGRVLDGQRLTPKDFA